MDASDSFLTIPLIIGVFSQLLHESVMRVFAAAYMYVDKIADDDIRNSAQQFLVLSFSV